jgi:Tol biopolymer transport system component
MPADLPTSSPCSAPRALRVAVLAIAALACAAFGVPAAGAATAAYDGASADGGTVFFTTTEKLVPGDTDSRPDVYERSFDEGRGTYVTREVSTGPTGGNDAFAATYNGASLDGSRVFFTTGESLVAADTDHSEDIYMRDLSNGTTTLVSQGDASCASPGCGNGPADSIFVGAAPDGSEAFFVSGEQLAGGDTDGAFDLYVRDFGGGATTTLVSKGAASCAASGCGNGAFAASFNAVSANGSVVVFSSDEQLADGDEDNLKDIYERNLTSGSGTTTLISGGGACPVGLDCNAIFRGSSADGSRVLFQTDQPLVAGDGDQASDVYAWTGGAPALVSTGSTGGNGASPATFAGASAAGGTVFFQTDEQLTSEDKDSATDIYARDLGKGTTALVSAPDTCPVSECNAVFRGASADGNTVFFQTSERLAPEDKDSATDVYARDLGNGATTLVSRGEAPCEAAGCGNGPFESRFAGSSADGSRAFFSSSESLSPADGDESTDIYMRQLTGTAATVLQSSGGICPLSEEKGCDASFDGASEDGSVVFFSTVKRLSAEDIDSESDVYERAGVKTRLVSVGNSIQLGPATPVLTGTDPASPGSSTTPAIHGQSDSGSAIKIYPTPDCSGAPAATGSSVALAGAGIAVTVVAGSTTSFHATATDLNGDTSGCSPAISYTQSSEPGEGEGGGGDEGDGGGGGAGGSIGKAPIGGGGATTSRGGAPHFAPQTRITFAPAFKTRARRPVFRFLDSTEQSGTTFRCRVDHQRWYGCSSPQRLKALRKGRHVFMVIGDNSGMSDRAPVVRNFKLVSK